MITTEFNQLGFMDSVTNTLKKTTIRKYMGMKALELINASPSTIGFCRETNCISAEVRNTVIQAAAEH